MEKGTGQVSSLSAGLTGAAEGGPQDPPVAQWITWPAFTSSAEQVVQKSL